MQLLGERPPALDNVWRHPSSQRDFTPVKCGPGWPRGINARASSRWTARLLVPRGTQVARWGPDLPWCGSFHMV